MSKRIGLIIGVVAVLGVIEAVPLFFETNPAVVAEPKWDSPETRALAQKACFDCHSNETKWPWYSRLAPVSYLIAFDTLRGRRELNFSEWGVNANGGGDEAGEGRRGGERDLEVDEKISEGEMPPANYISQHPEAQLTDAEKEQLIRGLEASLQR